eukprot:1142243-Pelagomonas_calceolata.AAC.2
MLPHASWCSGRHDPSRVMKQMMMKHGPTFLIRWHMHPLPPVPFPPVVHHEQLQVSHVVHQHLLEATGQHMPGLGVGAVPDVWHQPVALELTAHGIINTCSARQSWAAFRLSCWSTGEG